MEVKRVGALNKWFVNLYAHYPDSGLAFHAAVLNIHASDGEWSTLEMPDPIAGRVGQIQDPSVTDILLRQIALSPAFPVDPSNPLLVWSGVFETRCDAATYLTIRTDTENFWHLIPASCPAATCTASEAVRTVFCNPIDSFGWLAAPSPGTRAQVVGEALHLTPETPGGDIGVALGDERIDWSGPATFGARVDLEALDVGATFAMVWFPWALCWPVIEPAFSIEMTKTGPGALRVAPDFTRAGVSTVIVRAVLRGEVVAEDVLAPGAALQVFPDCDFYYYYDEDGNLTGKCFTTISDPFTTIFPSGVQVDADCIIVSPSGAQGAFGGVDRLQLVARDTRELIVLDAGDITPGGCYADCDGSGSLDIFDFLCFTNAFAAGDPYADCDGSGSLDIFDFLCFTDAFAAGCP